MDVSGLEIGRKASIRKRLAYILGAALTGAVMAVLGAIPSGSQTRSQDDDPDTGIAVERRLQRLEQNDARNTESIRRIDQNTEYIRQRLDKISDTYRQGNHR